MIVLHATLWLPITLLGAYYMLRESLSWQDIERAAAIDIDALETEPAATTSIPSRQDEGETEPTDAARSTAL